MRAETTQAPMHIVVGTQDNLQERAEVSKHRIRLYGLALDDSRIAKACSPSWLGGRQGQPTSRIAGMRGQPAMPEFTLVKCLRPAIGPDNAGFNWTSACRRRVPGHQPRRAAFPR